MGFLMFTCTLQQIADWMESNIKWLSSLYCLTTYSESKIYCYVAPLFLGCVAPVELRTVQHILHHKNTFWISVSPKCIWKFPAFYLLTCRKALIFTLLSLYSPFSKMMSVISLTQFHLDIPKEYIWRVFFFFFFWFRLYIIPVWILWFCLAQFHKNRDLKVQGSAPDINSTVNVACQFRLKTMHPPDWQIQISPERVEDCLDNLTSPRHVSHQVWPNLKEQVVLGCQS